MHKPSTLYTLIICVLLAGGLTHETTGQVSNIHLLPNGKIGMNTSTLLGFSDLTLKSTNPTGLGGMAIETPDGVNGKPFYGYAASGVVKAYSYYDFSTSTWKLNVAGDRLSVTAAGSVGIGTTSPVPSAILDITSSTKGFLPPRMSTGQRLAIVAPADGLMVFDEDEEGLFVYQGGVWERPGASVWDTSNPDNGIDYSDGKVGIGVAPIGDQRLVVQSIDETKAAFFQNSYIGSGLKYGLQVITNNGGTGQRYGIHANTGAPVSGTATTYGVYSSVQENLGSSTVYGLYGTTTGSGSGNAYGVFGMSNGSNHYGIYGKNNNADGFSGYFEGRMGVSGDALMESNAHVTDSLFVGDHAEVISDLHIGSQPGIKFDALGFQSAAEIELFDNDGTRTVAIRGNESTVWGGEMMMYNEAGDSTIHLSGQVGNINLGTDLSLRLQPTGWNSGSEIELYDDDGTKSLVLRGNKTTSSGAQILMYDDIGNPQVELDAEAKQLVLGTNDIIMEGTGNFGAAEIRLFDNDGTRTVAIHGNRSTTEGSELLMYEEFGAKTVDINGQLGDITLGQSAQIQLQPTGHDDAAELIMRDNDGDAGVVLWANKTPTTGALMLLRNEAAVTAIELDAEPGELILGVDDDIILQSKGHNSASELRMFDNDGTETVTIRGNATTTSGSTIWLANEAGGNTVDINGESGNINLGPTNNLRLQPEGFSSGAEIEMYDNDGDLTVAIRANENTGEGAEIHLRNEAGITTVQMDADRAGTGDGIIITDRLDFDESSNRFTVLNGEEADLNSDGYIQLGTTTGTNLVMATNHITARNNGSYAHMLMQHYGGDILLCGTENGQVGIGLTSTSSLPSPDYLLAVDGKVVCEEVRVELSGSWPDYVFDESYKLTPLSQLKADIDRLGHLPGIPSAEQVETEGLVMGEMQRKMMEKIEELTLYLIDQNEAMEALTLRVNQLESENAALRAQK